jgi:hypothetical protein
MADAAVSTFIDPSSYTWSAPLTTGTIWAGTTITVTAPTGETTAWCVNEVFRTVEDAFNRQGTYGYPVTAAERAFIEQCNALATPLRHFAVESGSVITDVLTALAWLHAAEETAFKLAWVPVLGQVGATLAAMTTGIDKAILEPILNDLIRVARQASNADLQLRELANAVEQHSMTLADAQTHLGSVAQYALSNFWQILLDLVKSIAP